MSNVIQMAANQKQDQLIDILLQIQARKTVKPEDATKALTQYRKVLEQIKELKKEIELFKANRGKQATQEEKKSIIQNLNKNNNQNNTALPKNSKGAPEQDNAQKAQPNGQSNKKPNSKLTTIEKPQPNQQQNGLPKPQPNQQQNGLPKPQPNQQQNGLTKPQPNQQQNGLTKPQPNQQQNVQAKSQRRLSEPANKTENSQLPSPRRGNGNTTRKASLQPNGSNSSRSSSVAQSVKDNKSNSSSTNGKSESVLLQTKLAQQTKDISEKDQEIARLRFQNAQLKVTIENRGTYSTTGPATESTLERKNFPLPQKLVIDFKVIFENEWKFAYQDLERHYKMTEEAITELLSAVGKEAFTFCQSFAKQQMDDINKANAYIIDVLVQPKYTGTGKQDVKMTKSKAIIDKEGYQLTKKHLKQYRKAMSQVPVNGLIELFDGMVQKDILLRNSNLRIVPKSLVPYMKRLIEVNWLMSLTEPQMFQVWLRCGQLMNREMFAAYGKKGATVIHTVWPAVLMQKEGELAERGLCLVK